jgi:transglutaminase-like putative cysteine protease
MVTTTGGLGWLPALLRRLSLPLVVVLQIVLAAVSLNRVYSGALVVELVAGAALGSVLLCLLLHRMPAWVVAPISVVAMTAYAGCALGVAARTGGVDGDLRALVIDAARNAVPRLLTALVPVEPQPDTVLGPVVLAWLAGFAGAELAVRARKPLAALLPPTLLYASALVLVGPNAPIALWQPLAFAGLAALGLVASTANSGAERISGITARQRTVLRVRTAGGVAAGLAAVLLVVVVVSPMVAGRVAVVPTDPRRYVQPPSLDTLDQNPLIRLSGWAADPEQPLFRVEILRGAKPTQEPTPSPTPSPSVDPFSPDVPPAPPDIPSTLGFYDTRLRLAVLPDWDGVTWHMDSEYRNAGRVLPQVAAPPGYQSTSDAVAPLTIEERITVEELSGRLLPAVSAPQRVEGIRVAYDQSVGSLLHVTPLTPGVSYTVTSVSPSIDVNLLQAADVPGGSSVARYLAVGPTVPAEMSTFAEKIAQEAGSPYLRALAVQTYLSEHYTFAVDAPSGHAYPNLGFFLYGDPRAGGQRGTTEQFATAFATLCRLLGLPTRVVVGFHTPPGGGLVTGEDALAWPEVLFNGVGWVAFDPLPPAGSQARPVEDEFLPKPPPPTSPPPSVTPPPAPTYVAPSTTTSPFVGSVPGPSAGTFAAGVGAGAIGLFAIAVLCVVLLRAVQTRRRLGSGAPMHRVVGAWHEVLDALVLAGRPPPGHLAAAEVADHAALVIADMPGRRHTRRPRPPAPPLADLAHAVNAVAFGGSSVAGPGETAAASAHDRALAFTNALYRRRPWWRRLLWRIDPRPLRRRG